MLQEETERIKHYYTSLCQRMIYTKKNYVYTRNFGKFFLKKRDVIQFFPCLWQKLAKKRIFEKMSAIKKATYLLIPVFSCKKYLSTILNLWKPCCLTQLCKSLTHKINQSVAWNFASTTSLNIKKQKNTFFPQQNSFSNLKTSTKCWQSSMADKVPI